MFEIYQCNKTCLFFFVLAKFKYYFLSETRFGYIQTYMYVVVKKC